MAGGTRGRRRKASLSSSSGKASSKQAQTRSSMTTHQSKSTSSSRGGGNRSDSADVENTDSQTRSSHDTSTLGKHTRASTSPKHTSRKRASIEQDHQKNKVSVPPPAPIYHSDSDHSTHAQSSVPHRHPNKHATQVSPPSDASSSDRDDIEPDTQDDNDYDAILEDSDSRGGDDPDQAKRARLAKKLALEMPVVTLQKPAVPHPTGATTVLGSLPSANAEGQPQATHEDSNTNHDDYRWPEDTNIRYSLKSNNGHINLGDQSERVRDICLKAMPLIWYRFCTEHALPTAKDSRAWLRDALAAIAQQNGDVAIHDRICKSDDYARTLCDIPLNRTETWRTRMASVAFALVESQYGVTSAQKDDIDELLHFSGSYKYCFAFVDPHSQIHVADMTKPYLLPIFGEVARACFKLDGGLYLREMQDRFKDSEGEYQMPQALLALSATLVHAALDFTRKGLKRGKGVPVQCVAYHDAYTGHLGVLEDLKTKESTARAYPILMRKLYRVAAGTDATDGLLQPAQLALPAVIKTNIEHIVVD